MYDLDAYWGVVIGLTILAVCIAACLKLQKMGKPYKTHIRKYPGLTFSSRVDHLYHQHNLTYFDVFKAEFEACLAISEGIPTYDELVECILSIELYSSKEHAIGYLITSYSHLNPEEYIRLFKDTGVNLVGFDLYDKVLTHVIKSQLGWCYEDPVFLETITRISELGGVISIASPVLVDFDLPLAVALAFCIGLHMATADTMCAYFESEYGYRMVYSVKTRLEHLYASGHIALNASNTFHILNVLQALTDTYCKRETLFNHLWRQIKNSI